MAVCEVCGNDYDKAFEVTRDGESHTFDAFECAIHALAPECAHCGCKIIGHGVEVEAPVPTQAGQSLAHHRRRILGEVDQHLPRLGHREGVEARGAGRHRECQVECEPGLTELGCTADKANGGPTPELLDEPSRLQLCLVELSGALGAEVLVVGSVARVGSELIATLKCVSASNGSVRGSWSTRAKTEEELLDFIDGTAKNLRTLLLGSAPPPPPGRSPPADDAGPAGRAA